MGIAKNDNELTTMIMIDLNSIIEEVMGKLLIDLKEFIESEVYSAGSPETYDRQREPKGLLGSFEIGDAEKNKKSVSSTIKHEPELMNSSPEDYIHGSPDYEPNDIRQFLAEIIIEGKSGLRWGNGWWRSPRDFWQPFIKVFKMNGDKYIQDGFKSRGIKYTKIK